MKTLYPKVERYSSRRRYARYDNVPVIQNWRIPFQAITASGDQLTTEGGIGFTTESGDPLVTE